MTKNLIDARYGLFINGEWVDAEGGKTFVTTNPATGEKLAECADASAADVDRAVKAARAAFATWSKTSVQERSEILLKIADLIEANAEKLAMVETLDNGKPIRETTLVDVPLAVDHFRYFAGCLRADEGSATVFDENTLSLLSVSRSAWWGRLFPGTSRS